MKPRLQKALAAGAAVVIGSAALFGVTRAGNAHDEENNDEFLHYLEKLNGGRAMEQINQDGYTIVPKADTVEFTDFLTQVCGQTKGEVQGAKKYLWHERGSFFSMVFDVKADGCVFEGIGDETTEPGVRKPFPGDWRTVNTWNCAQNAGNVVDKNYQTTKVSEEQVSWSSTISFTAGPFKDIFSASFSTTVGKSWSWGEWIWDGITIKVLPGQIGWLESAHDLRVQKGRFKLNFPDPIRSHYIWYTPEISVKTVKTDGNHNTFAQYRWMTDDEIRANCTQWDWNGNDPRKGDGTRAPGEGEGGPTPTPTPTSTEAPPAPAEWVVQKQYVKGDKVTYQSATYECQRDHVSQADWEPNRALDLWKRI